jgi:hypothetical protein
VIASIFSWQAAEDERRQLCAGAIRAIKAEPHAGDAPQRGIRFEWRDTANVRIGCAPASRLTVALRLASCAMAEDDSEWRQHSFNRNARRHEDAQWREYAAIRVAQEHTDPGPSEVRPGIQEYRQVQVVDSTLSGWETGFEWEMSSSRWEQHARDREERRNIDLDWREYAMARVEQREIFRTITVLVEVPAGVSGGDTIEFASEGRDEMNQVVVPEGLCQGDVFEVDMPHEEPEAEAASFRTPASANEIQEQEHVEMPDAAGAATMEELVVVIPEGVGSGDAIEVVSSGGSRFVVEVPPGLGSGMELSVSVPCDTLPGSPPEGSAARGDAPTGHGEAHGEAYGESHASMGRAPMSDSGSSLHVYASEELREPSAEPGYRYYAGQHIRMPRKRGGASWRAARGGPAAVGGAGCALAHQHAGPHT